MSDLVWPIAIIIAIVIDLMIGDAYWLPHPIRFFGIVIEASERIFNRAFLSLTTGAIIAITLPSLAFIGFYLLENAIPTYSQPIHVLYCSIVVFYSIAHSSLIREGKKVITALENEGLIAAKEKLRFIVGRDVSSLSEKQVVAATYETVSENLSDGVIAPLFYATILGPAGAMAYKMINTLDSMVGYRNDRYEHFGKASARLDDLVNFIPARLTALIMLLVSSKLKTYQTLRVLFFGRSSTTS